MSQESEDLSNVDPGSEDPIRSADDDEDEEYTLDEGRVKELARQVHLVSGYEEVLDSAARVFLVAKDEGVHLPVPGFPYTREHGRGVHITNAFHTKCFGWLLMSFRFLSSEFSIKYFLSCFIQFWLLDQKFHSLDCTGWKYPTIIVSHVRVNSKGYIRGIPLDREGIGEDPAMEVQCSSQNRLRFNKPLMHRVDNLAAIRIISLKDLPGNGGVSTLSLHDQSLLTIHLQLPGTGESTTPPIHTSSSSRNHGHRVQVHQPKRRRLNFTTRSIPPAHT